MDQDRDWEKDGRGKPYYVVYKNHDQPGERPTGKDWKIEYKKKRDMGVHALGTAKGRNIISTALQFLLDWAELSERDRNIILMFRESLFNCNPVDGLKPRKEKYGPKAN